MSPRAVAAALSSPNRATTARPELTPTRMIGRAPNSASISSPIAAKVAWIDKAARQARSGASSSASGTPNRAMMLSPAKPRTDPPCSRTAADQLFVDDPDEGEGSFVAEPFGDRGESNHVREQHGDLTPFAQRRRRASGGNFTIAHGRNSLTRRPSTTASIGGPAASPAFLGGP